MLRPGQGWRPPGLLLAAAPRASADARERRFLGLAQEPVEQRHDAPVVHRQLLAGAIRVAGLIDTGNVSVNNVLATQGNAELPFGGTKESGFGRYYGPHGLQSFSNTKSILVDSDIKHEVHWFPYTKQKYYLFSRLLDALYGGKPLRMIRTIFWGFQLEMLTKKNRL